MLVYVGEQRLLSYGSHYKLTLSEANYLFLARMCCYHKGYRRAWFKFRFVVHEEDAGTLDFEINVRPLELVNCNLPLIIYTKLSI